MLNDKSKQSQGRMILSPIFRILGWILAATTLWICTVFLELHWNLFDWKPEYDIESAGAISICGLALAGMWFLSQHTRDRASQIFSLIICLVLFGFAFSMIFPEKLSSNAFLGRDTVSPTWYRILRCCVSLLPAFFWYLGPLRIWRSRVQC